jgi:hypothetical protein
MSQNTIIQLHVYDFVTLNTYCASVGSYNILKTPYSCKKMEGA